MHRECEGMDYPPVEEMCICAGYGDRRRQVGGSAKYVNSSGAAEASRNIRAHLVQQLSHVMGAHALH